MRRNEFGKVDFGQKPERLRWFEVDDEGGVGQLELLKGERSMADAVDAGIAPVLVVILLNRTAGAVIRGEKFRLSRLIACHRGLNLRSMSCFAHAMSHRGKYDQ